MLLIDNENEPIRLLEYLCRVVNMTLKHETFSRQGPHLEFSSVLTVGEPVESIGCGGGHTESDAKRDAAWNLLSVIAEQGGEPMKSSETSPSGSLRSPVPDGRMTSPVDGELLGLARLAISP